MPIVKIRVALILALLQCTIIPLGWAGNTPVLNGDKKWRIGFYEGGPFSDYTETMRSLVDGLIASGWIEDQAPPPRSGDIVKPYWDWLVNCKSQYLSFRAEDSYSSKWDEQKRSLNREKILAKLRTHSLDLVIAMGTWAGRDLANNHHSVPVLVLSTSNPIKAGIIKSADDSGRDHVTARVDPNRYLRQLRMFSRIVQFSSLGVAYEDTADGRIYSAIDDVLKVSHERSFKVVLCKIKETSATTIETDQSCLDCFEKLAETTDAVYVTALSCIDRQSKAIADIFRRNKIPSFAQVGSRFVEQGFMLSISSDSEYQELGKYNAMKFGEILNGAKPRVLKQVFEDPLKIAVNMKSVRQMERSFPDSILKIATEIYEQ